VRRDAPDDGRERSEPAPVPGLCAAGSEGCASRCAPDALRGLPFSSAPHLPPPSNRAFSSAPPAGLPKIAMLWSPVSRSCTSSPAEIGESGSVPSSACPPPPSGSGPAVRLPKGRPHAIARHVQGYKPERDKGRGAPEGRSLISRLLLRLTKYETVSLISRHRHAA
jgi:hypothetical protein